MQFERRMAVIDDGAFDTLAALLDGPFAICSIITDAEGQAVDYRFLRVSPGFEEAIGLREIEGRTILEAAPGPERTWIDICGRVALERMPLRFTEGPTETGREHEIAAAPLDPPGRFVLVLRDVTERQRLEAEREAALAHERHLLRELSHRVMNSFAAISAILALEARAAPPEGREALKRVQGRVQALASLYRRLDGAVRVDRIEAADYLGGNISSFRDSLAASTGVTVAADLAPLSLPTQAALPLGLVLHELLTNAVKHAFAPGRPGTIHVSLEREGDLCRLRVADDGRGMAEGTGGSGIGRSLLDAFVAELGGELAYETGPQGTHATVTFRA